LNTPLTSSAGRLFDAVSALAGVNLQANYEAQAAIELEALVDPNEQSSYSVLFDPAITSIALDWLIASVVKDVVTGVSPFLVASRFHNAFVGLLVDVIMAMRNLSGVNSVIISGGVWQNITLLQKFLQEMHGRGLKVYTHSLLPPNDGGLALGQAVIAAHSTAIRS
jgi:hydrogenase maturation protein HypF